MLRTIQAIQKLILMAIMSSGPGQAHGQEITPHHSDVTIAQTRSPVTLLSANNIDQFIETGMAQLAVPGGAFALIDDGKVTHMRGFGRLDEDDNPVTPQNPFQIASLTKSFTSLIVLQMQDEGKLSIDDPVIKHIPYFRTTEPERSGAITIRHLMDHLSGISTLDGNRNQRTQYRGADATRRAVEALTKIDLVTAPGEKFHYSNANYATLTHLIEYIEQAPFERIVQDRIFSPLDMNNSYVQYSNRATPLEAKGHRQLFGFSYQSHFVAGRMKMGAGGITSSAEDIAKYLIAIAEGHDEVVPDTLIKSWTRKPKKPYEFGWQHDIINDQHIIFHDGANPGFRSVMMYNIATRKGAIFLMNMSGTLDGNLHYGAAQYALGLPVTDIAPSPLFAIILWGSAAMLAILFFSAVHALRRLVRNMAKPWHQRRSTRWAIIIIPSLILIGYAFSLWFYVPRTFDVNFAAVSLFNPDLGLLIIVQATVSIIWALVRVPLLIYRPNAMSSDHPATHMIV